LGVAAAEDAGGGVAAEEGAGKRQRIKCRSSPHTLSSQ